MPESRQAFEVATAQTSGLVNLIFSLVKRVSLHLFIDERGWSELSALCTKRTAVKPRFETISQQQAAHAQRS